jgi:hypothetical protein
MYADYVKLKDVEFRVRQGGKEKVRSEKRKNVHAFVIGELIEYSERHSKDIPTPSSNEIITYDPYKYDSFVFKNNGEPVFHAKEIDLINSNDKVFLIK